MEPTDLNFLKCTGKVNIAVPLEVDCSYQFTGGFDVYSVSKTSKQDGTFQYTFAGSFTDGISLIKGDQVILGKKKSSWSQKWRRLIEGYGMEYDKFMAWLFTKFDELREEYEAYRAERGDG